MSVADRRVVVGYAVAVLLALAGLAVTVLAARPLAGPFFMFQFAAVVGAALHGGFGPGLVTMALSGAGFYAVFLAPTLEGYEAYRLASFVLVSVLFAWLAAQMRAARRAAEAAQAKAEAAEAEARTIGAQQERLVAVVSHDLRNPLHVIAMSAEHLQRDALERQAKSLSRIVASTRRMHSIVHDLLDYARARHGSGLPVRPRPVRLGDICRSAIQEIRAAQPGGTILLNVTGDDSASLDPERVGQVVSNLVTNALTHGAAGSTVEVNVAEDDAGVRLQVANQGTIRQDVVPRLFEPFGSGDAPGAVGLGLFIVREIARSHGGSVSVRSGEPGTTFTVVFPKRVSEAPTAAALA